MAEDVWSQNDRRRKRAERLIALAAWATLGFIAYATLVPLSERPQMAADPNLERFVAFAGAAALLTLAYPRRVVRVAVFMVAIAIGLEILQRFAVDRHAELPDMAVKICGAIAGVVVARTGWWLAERYTANSRDVV